MTTLLAGLGLAVGLIVAAVALEVFWRTRECAEVAETCSTWNENQEGKQR